MAIIGVAWSKAKTERPRVGHKLMRLSWMGECAEGGKGLTLFQASRAAYSVRRMSSWRLLPVRGEAVPVPASTCTKFSNPFCSVKSGQMWQASGPTVRCAMTATVIRG